jgi:hypothetical protein
VRKLLLVAILLCLILIVAACKASNDDSMDEPTQHESKIEQQAVDMHQNEAQQESQQEEQPQQESQQEEQPQQVSHKEENTQSETGLQSDSPSNSSSPIVEPEESIEVKSFLQIKGLGLEQSVIYYEGEDLDRDGNDEIVVALGVAVDDYAEVYILRSVEGQFVLLGDNLNNGGYGINKIRLVQLENRQDLVIELGLTNWASMSGFELIAIEDGLLVELAYSAAAVGVGEDYLIDTDGNGMYDGYKQQRYSYDVFYYPVTRTFTLEGNTFEQTEWSVDLYEYPAGPEETLIEYFALGGMGEPLPANVAERRQQLCNWCTVHDTDMPFFKDYELISDLVMGFGEYVTMDLSETDNHATATLSYRELVDGAMRDVTFHLTKDQKHWTITNVEAPDPIP